MKTNIYNMVAENSSPKLGEVPQAEGAVITAATSALTDPLGASATPPNLGGEFNNTPCAEVTNSSPKLGEVPQAEGSVKTHNLTAHIAQRKELRTNGTAAEATLWKMLKARQVMGKKFRRQFGIESYVLDFYCPEARLAVELDGQPHYTIEGDLHDTDRDEHLLATHGIRTLRFENCDVFRNPEGVLAEIKEALQNSSPKLGEVPVRGRGLSATDLTDPSGLKATSPNLGEELNTPNAEVTNFPPNLGEQLKSTIRKATALCTLYSVLCTLCSVLLLSSCTHEEITAPANGLPQGMRAVTVDIRLPEGKPGFDGQSTDGRVQSTGTRGISEVTNSPSKLEGVPVGGGSLSAADFTDSSAFGTSSNLEEESVTLYSELCTPNSSRTATTSWAEGDELMMSVAVGDAEGDLVVVALTLTCDENGTWDVLTDKSYSAIVLDRNLTIKPYTELPLLAKVTDLTLGEELTLMVDEAMGEVAYHQVDFYYAPEMELTSDGTSPDFALKADASTTAPELWKANYEYNVATGEKHEQMWETHTARLRVYTGAEGDEVTLSSGQFWPYNVEDYNAGTYTATTGADGYAYFYGTLTEQTSGFTVSLTAVKVGDGESAVTCPVSPVTLLEATDLVPVKLEAAKSYKLDASAKRPDTEKWAIFSSADITAEAVAAALAEGKSTLHVSGEVTEAVKTAVSGQANGSIDLVLTEATVIGEQAFIGCSALTSVSAPKVTSIGNNAFFYCSALTSVELPAATEIGEYAFYYCSALTSVSLPSATSIGGYAFEGCKALTSVSLPLATSIGDYAFSSCSALESVSLPAATSIGDYAFEGCKALTSVSLPAATSIGNYAFNNCSALTSVELPAATTIGNNAFYYCSALTSVTLPAATTIGQQAFRGCSSLESVTMPAATMIGDYAFNNCTALTSVTLPAATTIGQQAFRGCSALESVTMPAATTIGDYAFSFCTKLTTLTFGEVITEVGTSAFSGITTENVALTLAAGQESHETYPADVADRRWAKMTWASITLLP